MIIIAKMLNIGHMGPLSNALNKTGISQEIDFKHSDYLECFMRHTNHKLVLIEACYQSGLPVFEGAELAMHQ